MNVFPRLMVVLLSGAAAYGQGATRPSFEVASIHLSPPLATDSRRELDLFMRLSNNGVKADPSQVRYTYKTLRELIPIAYRVEGFQVSAPEWMGDAHYDITAKIPDGVSTDLAPEMLQSLLEDRFKLTYHRVSKDVDLFVLSAAAGGPKIPRKPSDYKFSRNSTESPQTMDSLATSLAHALGRPVLNQTGLDGEYMVPHDFRTLLIRATVGQMGVAAADDAMEVPSANDIRRSVQAFGLSLEPGKRAFPLLVIDHAERTPTEN